jgi:hypothetical protein
MAATAFSAAAAKAEKFAWSVDPRSYAHVADIRKFKANRRSD